MEKRYCKDNKLFNEIYDSCEDKIKEKCSDKYLKKRVEIKQNLNKSDRAKNVLIMFSLSLCFLIITWMIIYHKTRPYTLPSNPTRNISDMFTFSLEDSIVYSIDSDFYHASKASKDIKELGSATEYFKRTSSNFIYAVILILIFVGIFIFFTKKVNDREEEKKKLIKNDIDNDCEDYIEKICCLDYNKNFEKEEECKKKGYSSCSSKNNHIKNLQEKRKKGIKLNRNVTIRKDDLEFLDSHVTLNNEEDSILIKLHTNTMRTYIFKDGIYEDKLYNDGHNFNFNKNLIFLDNGSIIELDENYREPSYIINQPKYSWFYQNELDKPENTKPVTKKPVTKQPITTKSVTKKPVTKQPITTKSVTKQPVSTKSVTKKPVTKNPVQVKNETIEPK
jgi:hypothetical protein